MDDTNNLPPNWIKTESKSRPNYFYYFNTKTSESRWTFPSPPKKTNVKANKGPENIRIAEDRVINAFKNGSPKKNTAEHRLKRLQESLKCDQKHNKTKTATVPAKNVSRGGVNNNNVQNSKKLKAAIIPIQPKPAPPKPAAPKPKFKTVAAPPTSAKVNVIRKEIETKVDLKRKSLPANLPKPLFSTPTNNNESELIYKKPNSAANDRLSNFRKNLSDKKIEENLGFQDVEMTDILRDYPESDEEMEWETITDEKILEEVTEIRLGGQQNDNVVNIGVSSDYLLDFRDDHFYIVVDTNIFLANLGFLESLVGKNIKNVGYPILIVPYVVIQELDGIKSRSAKSLSSLAMKSIHFLNKMFQSQSQFVKGQTSIESNKHLIEIQNSDDKILNCCIQISQNTKRVVLLSNDVNLRNKSIIHQVNAYSKIDVERSRFDAGVPGNEILLKFL